MKNFYFKVNLSCLPFLMSTAQFRLVPCKTNNVQTKTAEHKLMAQENPIMISFQASAITRKVQCNYGQTETYCSNRFGTIIQKPVSIFFLVTVICSLLCLQGGGETLEQTFQPIWCLEWSISGLHVITENAENKKTSCGSDYASMWSQEICWVNRSFNNF